ncbi:LPD7 domain-containing protein, partial [Vibrio sp. R78045]|uniref:LPD7 domain-containing protein n=1 Tax=Vibrio sp. R78045 TaxID=3093868 RepID=UPI0036F3CF35
MLARVTSGKDGIIEYLENGMKSGRELSRDELDHRVCIEGNISITDDVIKQLVDEDKKENYLHITLSFGERDLSEDKIIAAYDDYKKSLMTAYDVDEYNIYAEIHHPKVKSYTDRKTGEKIERFPHVHIVIPKKNLITDKSLNPFGKYNDNIPYHDSIQESVNIKHDLESPYDHQRKYRIIKDDSEFISRYKGDNFKGARAEFKTELFSLINDKNIRSMKVFENELSKFGEVSRGKAGSTDEYLKVKLEGENKNIRLKDSCFKPEYIVDRQLTKPKPTKKQVDKLLNEWIDTRSHEMKHIHPASPKLRKEYYALNSTDKGYFLNERRREYNQTNNIGSSRRKASVEPRFERDRPRSVTAIRNGLPSLPQRGLARTDERRSTATQSVLSGNENDDLDTRRTSRHNELRRSINRDRGRGGRGLSSKVKTGLPSQNLSNNQLATATETIKPKTLAERYLQEHNETRTTQQDLKYFRLVRQKLDPELLLDSFEKSHGLIREHYTTSKAKNGSPRIKIGSRAYNVSDFCTQHMHLSWKDTKALLSETYQAQKQSKTDRHEINSIVFVSQYTQSYSTKAKLSRVNESMMIFKHLKMKEKLEGNKMPISDLEIKHRAKPDASEEGNSISNAELDLRSITDNFKRQQEVARQLTYKMGDLVPTKDLKDKHVDFSNKHSGELVFRDYGHRIVMNNRNPDSNQVAQAMTLASEKFGTVNITGSKEFKQRVIDVAVAKDLNIVFKSKAMQAEFIKCKEEAQAQTTLNQAANKHDSPVQSDTNKDTVSPLVSELTPTAKIIKEALSDAERVKSDLSSMNSAGNND